MSIKCITFDLDDTLWAIHPVIAEAEKLFHEWMQQHLPKITTRYNIEALTDHRHDYFDNFPDLHHDLGQLRRNWVSHLMTEQGYSGHSVEEGFEIFWRARNNVILFENSIEVLDYTNRHYVTGAITNGNADIHQIGIGDYFNFCLTSAAVGNSKPHRNIFDTAIRHAACRPDQIIHVGDDPIRDIAGAANAGMRTVWVNLLDNIWEGSVAPDAEIQALGELPKVLQSFD